MFLKKRRKLEFYLTIGSQLLYPLAFSSWERKFSQFSDDSRGTRKTSKSICAPKVRFTASINNAI